MRILLTVPLLLAVACAAGHGADPQSKPKRDDSGLYSENCIHIERPALRYCGSFAVDHRGTAYPFGAGTAYFGDGATLTGLFVYRNHPRGVEYRDGGRVLYSDGFSLDKRHPIGRWSLHTSEGIFFSETFDGDSNPSHFVLYDSEGAVKMIGTGDRELAEGEYHTIAYGPGEEVEFGQRQWEATTGSLVKTGQQVSLGPDGLIIEHFTDGVENTGEWEHEQLDRIARGLAQRDTAKALRASKREDKKAAQALEDFEQQASAEMQLRQERILSDKQFEPCECILTKVSSGDDPMACKPEIIVESCRPLFYLQVRGLRGGVSMEERERKAQACDQRNEEIKKRSEATHSRLVPICKNLTHDPARLRSEWESLMTEHNHKEQLALDQWERANRIAEQRYRQEAIAAAQAVDQEERKLRAVEKAELELDEQLQAKLGAAEAAYQEEAKRLVERRLEERSERCRERPQACGCSLRIEIQKGSGSTACEM